MSATIVMFPKHMSLHVYCTVSAKEFLDAWEVHAQSQYSTTLDDGGAYLIYTAIFAGRLL